MLTSTKASTNFSTAAPTQAFLMQRSFTHMDIELLLTQAEVFLAEGLLDKVETLLARLSVYRNEMSEDQEATYTYIENSLIDPFLEDDLEEWM